MCRWDAVVLPANELHLLQQYLNSIIISTTTVEPGLNYRNTKFSIVLKYKNIFPWINENVYCSWMYLYIHNKINLLKSW